ncbi:RHS repeat-associated core domain [Methylophilaceae bacterium 11]|nr:RHS repeat-associated core domain [Methylophilaceae bacterium 11]
MQNIPRISNVLPLNVGLGTQSFFTTLLRCACLWISLLVLAAAWPVNADTATNASTDPTQPNLGEVLGTTTGQGTTPGSQAGCSDPAGPACDAGAGNPINVMTGNKYQQEEDLPALPGNMGIEIVRHYNSLHMGLGQIGYGWRLGYEIDLYPSKHSIRIIQADGSQTIFNRSVFNPSDCACQDPAQGHVMIYHTAQGDEYTWFMTNGKQLHFNHLGKLERITAATGESTHLLRGPKGELLKVTDPQGRSLVMHYADKQKPGFKGIVAIDTPVGRFEYLHNNDLQSAGISNLIQVTYPQDNASQTTSTQDDSAHHTARSKIYHYGEVAYVDAHMAPANAQRPQIPHAAHLLTGISLSWIDSNSQAQHHTNQRSTERQRTWSYDQYGRGILSVHGIPNSKNATQSVKVSYHVVPLKPAAQQSKQRKPSNATQPYPRITHNGQIGQTTITNSAGLTTTYNYTLIAGEYRLLQILGAGCSECAAPNVVYGYDKFGRQTDVTKVSLLNISHSDKTNQPSKPHQKAKPVYQAISTIHTDYDLSGRVVKISNIAYRNGQAQAPQMQVRYAYANTPLFPQLKQANRAAQESVQVFNQPSIIAKPSVIAGKEHQWQIRYNQYGQPTQMTETGYRPVLATDSSKTPSGITRTTTYTYANVNGRSLLSQTDGPLPNGKTNTPKDSDITQYQYDKLGQYLTQITAPNNVTTQLVYDTSGAAIAGSAAMGGTGRVVQTVAGNGVATQFTYNAVSKILSTQRYPATLSLGYAKTAGLLQTTAMQYDVFGNTTMMQRADSQTVHLQYGTDGKLTQLRDGLGNRVEWNAWGKGNIQDASHTVSTQQWFTADAPDTVARAWYFWHDNQQRLTQRLSPDGGVDTWRYSDAQGSGTPEPQADESGSTATLPMSTQWVEHIDPLNRMTLSAVSGQGTAQIRMTPAGYVDVSIQSGSANNTNAQGNAKQTMGTTPSQSSQIKDDFGRTIQFNSPQHGTHTAQYDAANHITHMTQADGTQIDYRYDVSGRLLSKTAKPISLVKFTLNQAQHLNKPANDSQTADTIHYAYNAFGLLQIQDAHQTIRYTQDLLGRETDKATTLILQNNQASTYHIRTRYDALGHIKAKQLIDGQWLVFTLNDKTGLTTAMRLHSTIWPSLTNKLADWLNLPDLPLQIATRQSIVTDITAHPFNGITHLTHGNGMSDDYTFDLVGRLTTVSHGIGNGAQQHPSNNKTGNPLIQASYTYDAGRRLTSEAWTDVVNRRQVNQYAYQGWNQLATKPQAGLIKAVATTTTASTTVSRNESHYKSVESQNATLDRAGRTVADTDYRYSYNAWGKLSAVQANTNNKTIATYQHNALGERIMTNYPTESRARNTAPSLRAEALSDKRGNLPPGQTRYYLYDHQQRIAELDEKGHVLQQYLYINQTPVAVINTPTDTESASNKQNPTGIIAIHTDRRNAPIAATDEQGKVIWQTQYDAWGRASPIQKVSNTSSENAVGGELVEPQTQPSLRAERGNPNQTSQHSFNLALRLPGQWQDQATGLHYNYQRDYNPDTGRYLTPDPLGFPDGTDSYAYVNNDPLNKIDPLGLYQSDIHYYMTFFLAVAAGVPAEDARIIALATQYIDRNTLTQPLDDNLGNAAMNILFKNKEVQSRLLSYHFVLVPSVIGSDGLAVADPNGQNPTNNLYANPYSDQLDRLYDAVTKAECKNTKLQFFGEYLHAFEDTFSHRNSKDVPYPIYGGFGHGTDGSNPDFTYNHGKWQSNEDRTLQMEMEVFQQMNQFAVAGNLTKDWQDLISVMEQFNATAQHEDGHDNPQDFASDPSKGVAVGKLDLLNAKLAEWGFKNADGSEINLLNQAEGDPSANGFIENEAKANRNNFLCDASGQRLKQTNYPGTILPTTSCP